jgi:hypothetical protein
MAWSRKKKGALIAAVLAAVGLVAYLGSFYQEDRCWQCGAKRIETRLGTKIVKTPDSLRVEKILGHPCEHRQWKLDYYRTWTILGDGFAKRSVPILCRQCSPSGLVDFIELLPRPEWQRQAVLAVGDPGNRLKWLSAAVLINRGVDLGYAFGDSSQVKTMSDGEWQAWWAAHSKYFEIVTDRESAADLADEYRRSVPDDHERKYWLESIYEIYLRQDLDRKLYAPKGS